MRSVLLFICILGFVALLRAAVPVYQLKLQPYVPASAPMMVGQLISRQATSSTEQKCANSSLVLCNPEGVSLVCCPQSDQCCADTKGQVTYCIPKAGSCCTGGGGCDEGYQCCGHGCIPIGSMCCGNTTTPGVGWCPTNHTCLPPQASGDSWMCSSALTLSVSFSLSLLVFSFYVLNLLF